MIDHQTKIESRATKLLLRVDPIIAMNQDTSTCHKVHHPLPPPLFMLEVFQKWIPLCYRAERKKGGSKYFRFARFFGVAANILLK